MKIKEVTIHAARTFNHPHEQYSNLRPSVTLVATVDEGEDASAVVKHLQAQAETMVEDHKQSMLKSLEDLFELTERQRELTTLGAQIGQAQRRLDQIREAHPQLTLTGNEAEA